MNPFVLSEISGAVQKTSQVQGRISLSGEQIHVHARAVKLSRLHRRTESKIIEVLTQVEKTRLYRNLGHTSLFSYVVEQLKFSEAVAFSFISVMRKMRECPELKKAVENQELSVSKIQRMVSVISAENSVDLIGFAKTHTNREIEREAARRNPRVQKGSIEKYLNEDCMQLKISMSEENYRKIKRAQNLESQRTKAAVSLSDTLVNLAESYLERHDPIRKAQRDQTKSKKIGKSIVAAATSAIVAAPHAASGSAPGVANAGADAPANTAVQASASVAIVSTLATATGTPAMTQKCTELPFLGRVGASQYSHTTQLRRPLTAAIKHAIVRRDGGRCTHLGSDGVRCKNERWLEVHHIRAVIHGGNNDLENLATLCGMHHDLIHQLSLPIDGQMNWLRAPSLKYG